MGNGASLNVQPWQIAGTDRLNRHANATTRQALKDKLLGPFDASDLLGASSINPAIKQHIIRIVGSRDEADALDPADTNSTLGPDGAAKGLPKRMMSIEYLTSTLQRLRNRNIYNFFIVVLSLLALSNNLPHVFWGILCSMGMLFSKEWTLKLAKELGDQVVASEVPGASQNVGIVVADNKCYFSKTTFRHNGYEDENGVLHDATDGHFLYTNNRLHWPVVLESELDIERG